MNNKTKATRPRRTGTGPEQITSTTLYNGLTLDVFRSSPERVSFAQGLFANPRFREMMSVLQNTMPVPDLANPHAAAVEAGRVRGYQTAIQVLLMMAQHNPGDPVELKVTYDTPVEDTIDIED